MVYDEYLLGALRQIYSPDQRCMAKTKFTKSRREQNISTFQQKKTGGGGGGEYSNPVAKAN